MTIVCVCVCVCSQMLLWGVEARDLESLQLTARFPSYECWTAVSSHQSDILLTNAMAVIESCPSSVPRLPPRLRLPGSDSRRGAPGTPGAQAAAAATDQPAAPPLPASKAPPRATAAAGNGRRHRKKEFQLQPSRARCEVRLSTA